jgi:hypothetical protein
MSFDISTLFSIGCAFLFLLIFLFLVRSTTIRPFYTTTWFVVAIAGVAAAVFNDSLNNIAISLGLTSATELIMAGLFFFCLVTMLHLSIKASAAGDRIQELISYTSILEHRIRHLEKDS